MVVRDAFSAIGVSLLGRTDEGHDFGLMVNDLEEVLKNEEDAAT